MYSSHCMDYHFNDIIIVLWIIMYNKHATWIDIYKYRERDKNMLPKRTPQIYSQFNDLHSAEHVSCRHGRDDAHDRTGVRVPWQLHALKLQNLTHCVLNLWKNWGHSMKLVKTCYWLLLQYFEILDSNIQQSAFSLTTKAETLITRLKVALWTSLWSVFKTSSKLCTAKQ